MKVSITKNLQKQKFSLKSIAKDFFTEFDPLHFTSGHLNGIATIVAASHG